MSEWIKSGDALLNGEMARPRDTLRGGESVQVQVVLETQTHAAPQDIPLSVLYEDDQVLVIDKPAGLVVHPGAGNPDGTLVNALLFRDPALAAVPRAGVVHRLDKDTSGVMVVARTVQAQTALVEQLSARDVHRQYLAVVVGALVSGGTANAPIDRHPRDRLKMAVRDDGRDAVTHYRLRERFRAHTALECRLETGRTHQIRVHMAHLKSPIVGDPLYGGALKLPKGATDDLVHEPAHLQASGAACRNPGIPAPGQRRAGARQRAGAGRPAAVDGRAARRQRTRRRAGAPLRWPPPHPSCCRPTGRRHHASMR